MSEFVHLNILKKLIETVCNEFKCNVNEKEELEKICSEVKAVFQCTTSDPVWFIASSDVRDLLIKAIVSLVQKARLPQVLSNENEEASYKEWARVTVLTASSTVTILTNLHEGQSSLDDANDERKEEAQRLVRDVVRTVASHCVALFATHHDENYPWTNNKSRQVTEGLGAVLCKMSHCDSVQQLLREGPTWSRDPNRQGLFKDILGLHKERLTRDEWDKEPGTRQAFRWCLLQMKHPYLGEHLESILPPSLLFIDNYKVSNKLLGIQCLHHIINNVDPTELRWYGRAVVIYEALHHQLYTQKPALIGQLLPCLLSILAVVERSPHKADEPRKPNRYDTILQAILTSMEFEQKLALRQAYAKSLHLFIDAMGITVLRHMKMKRGLCVMMKYLEVSGPNLMPLLIRGLRVMMKYLEVSDGQDDVSWMYTLQALNSLICQAWPRIPNHWETILKVLLKLLCSVCDNSSQMEPKVRRCLVDSCVDCLVLLKRCCKKDVEEALHEIAGIIPTENATMKHCVERALAS